MVLTMGRKNGRINKLSVRQREIPQRKLQKKYEKKIKKVLDKEQQMWYTKQVVAKEDNACILKNK